MTHVDELYASKRVSAEAALSRIKDGQRVLVGSGCAEPLSLVEALCKVAPKLQDVEVVHLLTVGSADYVKPQFAGHLRHNAFFIGANVRGAVQNGQADYTPVFLSEIPALIRSGQRKVDVVLLQVSPPDRHGYCSMGINVDIQRAAVDTAKVVIVEVNPNMPRTFGDTALHLDDIDCCVATDAPLLELAAHEADEATQRIGHFVARLIDDGACIQAGIGAIPAAALRSLTSKRDLGVHTEMFTEALIPLLEAGNVNNRLKRVHPGVTVTGFVMGTRALYDYLDDNPSVRFYGSDHINDPRIICQNDRVVAINSALQVDLTGQVCADSMGHRFYSGIGGQVDFIRGAAMSRGGKPIIALPSTAKQGTVSRIVPVLDEGAGVVTSRGDVHYVVTEYGVAYLHGKTIRERALALINVAHPDARADLLSYVKQRHYVYDDEQVWKQATNTYPQEVEHMHMVGDKQLLVRPVKASDERALQEFFYSQPAGSIQSRHFSDGDDDSEHLSHREAAALCCVDYKREMAIGAFEAAPGGKLSGFARYALSPESNMAEVVVLVGHEYRRKGIAGHLIRCLEQHAARHGIRGFYSTILPTNTAALAFRNSTDATARWDPDSQLFYVEHLFETGAPTQ